MKRLIQGLVVLVLLIIISACQMDNEGSEGQLENESEETSIIEKGASEKAGEQKEIKVNIMNAQGEETAHALLKEEKTGVSIKIEAWDLPKGTHGFHIHEKGICEKPDFKSAGGHFNPFDSKHGFDNPKGPHAGDLPNLEVGSDGKVSESFLNEMVTLQEGELNSLIREGGTSIVIHAKADDNITQPAGDAGERIACGVIK